MQKLGNHGQHILVFRQFTWVYWLTEFPCMSICHSTHCVKSVRIWCYSCPHFPTFGLNTERYGVSLRIQSECGKIQTRKTRNTDTFHTDKLCEQYSLESMTHSNTYCEFLQVDQKCKTANKLFIHVKPFVLLWKSTSFSLRKIFQNMAFVCPVFSNIRIEFSILSLYG